MSSITLKGYMPEVEPTGDENSHADQPGGFGNRTDLMEKFPGELTEKDLRLAPPARKFCWTG